MLLNFLSSPKCVIHQKRKHLEAGFVLVYDEKWQEFQKDFNTKLFLTQWLLPFSSF